jgi:A/G-specific adenine glycosylase
MELGATICTPKSPQCSACPLSELCLARRRGTVADRPAKKASRPPKPVRINVAVVVRHTSPPEILLTRNPDEGLLGGMWGLPESDPTPDGVHTIPLPTVRHRFSHLDAMYVARLIDADHIPFLAEPELRPQSADPPARRWIREDELMSAAVPVAQRKIVMSAFEVLRAD